MHGPVPRAGFQSGGKGRVRRVDGGHEPRDQLVKNVVLRAADPERAKGEEAGRAPQIHLSYVAARRRELHAGVDADVLAAAEEARRGDRISRGPGIERARDERHRCPARLEALQCCRQYGNMGFIARAANGLQTFGHGRCDRHTRCHVTGSTAMSAGHYAR